MIEQIKEVVFQITECKQIEINKIERLKNQYCEQELDYYNIKLNFEDKPMYKFEIVIINKNLNDIRWQCITDFLFRNSHKYVCKNFIDNVLNTSENYNKWQEG